MTLVKSTALLLLLHHSWYEAIDVGDGKVQMRIDTGAEKNVLPLKTFKKLPNAELKQVTKPTQLCVLMEGAMCNTWEKSTYGVR